MPDSLHEISIAAPSHEVYDAWTTTEGLAAWWTKRSRIADQIGGTNVLVFVGGDVEIHFRVDDQVPGKRIRWTGIAADRMPPEWVDTRLEVDFQPADGGTLVHVTHAGWRSTGGMYRQCNSTWGELMFRLRDHCEGRGRGVLPEGA